MQSKQLSAALIMVGLASVGLSANAQTLVNYTTDTTATNPADSKSLAFNAVFSIPVPGTLKIDLTNLTTGTITANDTLSGVFFNLTGNTAQPADGVPSVATTLPAGSTVVRSTNGNTFGSQAVAGEFGFKDVSGVTGTSFKYMVNATVIQYRHS